MFFFGQYEFKVVKEVIGVAHGRFKEWGIEPSIAKAAGPGRRNIYSRNDLYLIQLYKRVFEAGWDRKTAKNFIEAIKKEKFEKLVRAAHDTRLTSILELFERTGILTPSEIKRLFEASAKDESFEGNILPFLAETLNKSADEIRTIYDCVVKSLVEWDNKIDLLLIFFRDRDLDQFGLVSADSFIRRKEPLSEDAPSVLRITNQKHEKIEIDHLLFGLSVSGDAYVVEFTSIVNDVDMKLQEAFPTFVPYEDLAMISRDHWKEISKLMELNGV
jgi:hypothetical protein